jgi:hypothetical protein
MSTNAFWTNHQTDPKRKYRFTVEINDSQASGLEGVLWFAKTVDKPEITVNTGEVNYMSHKFYFPGTVEWNEVNLVLVDPIQPDAAANTLEILTKAGYLGPNSAIADKPITLSKKSAFQVVITQIDAAGNPQETWTLKNAIVTKLGFGDLDYSSEDLSEISMTFRYDWAECEVDPPGATKQSFFDNK